MFRNLRTYWKCKVSEASTLALDVFEHLVDPHVFIALELR